MAHSTKEEYLAEIHSVNLEFDRVEQEMGNALSTAQRNALMLCIDDVVSKAIDLLIELRWDDVECRKAREDLSERMDKINEDSSQLFAQPGGIQPGSNGAVDMEAYRVMHRRIGTMEAEIKQLEAVLRQINNTMEMLAARNVDEDLKVDLRQVRDNHRRNNQEVRELIQQNTQDIRSLTTQFNEKTKEYDGFFIELNRRVLYLETRRSSKKGTPVDEPQPRYNDAFIQELMRRQEHQNVAMMEMMEREKRMNEQIVQMEKMCGGVMDLVLERSDKPILPEACRHVPRILDGDRSHVSIPDFLYRPNTGDTSIPTSVYDSKPMPREARRHVPVILDGDRSRGSIPGFHQSRLHGHGAEYGNPGSLPLLPRKVREESTGPFKAHHEEEEEEEEDNEEDKEEEEEAVMHERRVKFPSDSHLHESRHYDSFSTGDEIVDKLRRMRDEVTEATGIFKKQWQREDMSKPVHKGDGSDMWEMDCPAPFGYIGARADIDSVKEGVDNLDFEVRRLHTFATKLDKSHNV